MKDDSHEKYKPRKIKYCSFCGKDQYEVNNLIEGAAVYICNECIDVCNNLIRESKQNSDNKKNEKK